VHQTSLGAWRTSDTNYTDGYFELDDVPDPGASASAAPATEGPDEPAIRALNTKVQAPNKYFSGGWLNHDGFGS
jgi:hypothetical protein